MALSWKQILPGYLERSILFNMTYKKSLFIFRRDLRIEDNVGLQQALAESKEVLPVFIFDSRQVEKHKYRSMPGLQFLIGSLKDLQGQLKKKKGKLFIYSGIAEEVVAELIDSEEIEAVFLNRDYTPFSKKRDLKIEKACKTKKIEFFPCNDLLLNEPDAALKADGTPYVVFTPFFRNASEIPVQKPKRTTALNYCVSSEKKSIDNLEQFLPESLEHILLQGGRAECKEMFTGLKRLDRYDEIRDFPAESGTTNFSAHLKFGTCSVREIYYGIEKRLGEGHPLLRQLYWRDFFTHIAFHFPHVFEGAFRKEYNALEWANNKKWFRHWCEGKTGFPIVDAGMRELNSTGYMHNRVRMVVASFLVKDLHIDWRKGEQYFATKLIDYDPAVNNGNWQWAASTGCDAQPYFRIFNPWRQQERFDPECKYIKKWIPELESLSPKEIHKLEKSAQPPLSSYPAPIVHHSEQTDEAREMFERVKGS